MLQLTWKQAAAWRVRRHHLDRRAPARDMLAVVSRLCGLQAQVMSSAELMLWARVENLDRKAVQHALWEERTLVKTWAMRGTLHLLPSSELPLWHAALGASGRFLREGTWKKHFGVTLAELDRITEAISSALDGRLVTREDLAIEVARLTGSRAFSANIAENSWGTILRPAAFSGRLCFAPSIGQRVRFTHPKSWLPASGDPDPVDPQAAAATITHRYLAAYGPVTYRDLGRWWMGGSGVKARQWIASLGDEATQVEVQGTRAWMLARDARKSREYEPVKSVRLLPGFDQYVLSASCHAAQLMPAGLARSLVYRPQGWITPVLLVNGWMLGAWRHTIHRRRGLEVTVEPFDKIPAWVRRAAEQESERLAAFLGCQLSRVRF